MAANVHDLNLLTVRETAALLKQSERSVRRKVHSGQIPAVRLGDGTGPLRIPEDELEQWLYSVPAAMLESPAHAGAPPGAVEAPSAARESGEAA